MPGPAKKILLFDIDSTLLYTGGAGRIAINLAFEEVFGIRRAWQDIVPDGKTDPQIFEEILSQHGRGALTEEEHRKLCGRYIFHFRREIKKSEKFRLMPGIPRLLEILDGYRDFLLGIATGNLEETAWLKLEQGGLRSYFGFGGFGSDSRDRTEMTRLAVARGRQLCGGTVNPGNIFLIGDAPQDILAGKALKLRTIAVATGRTSLETLTGYGPDFILKDLSGGTKFLGIIAGPETLP